MPPFFFLGGGYWYSFLLELKEESYGAHRVVDAPPGLVQDSSSLPLGKIFFLSLNSLILIMEKRCESGMQRTARNRHVPPEQGPNNNLKGHI